MNCLRKGILGVIILFVGGAGSLPVFAQQEGAEKPARPEIPPAVDANNNQQNENQEPQQLQPDSQPLSSVLNPTLGTSEMRHSYWAPGIKYSNSALSNSLNPGVQSGWNTTSFVSGDMSLLQAWSHSLLSANYSGGGFFSTDSLQGNGQYHQLSTAYEVDHRIWQLLLVDQFSYLPQTGFGFGGPGALGFPGINGALAVPLPGLQPALLPNQTIVTLTGPRYSDASAAQLTFAMGPRDSITFAGVYGLLRFVNPGNIDCDSEIFNVGYNHAISRKDTIGLVYTFSAYHFPSNPQALGDHVGQFVYGRKITARLTLRLGGGPEVTEFRVPIGVLTQKVSGSGSGALIYGFSRGDISLNFMHGLSGGSGVFSGSTADVASASWSRQLTRVWNTRVNFGYARNSQILSLPWLTAPVFDSWIAGAGLSRAIGRMADFSLGYQAQLQNSNVAVCNTPSCGTNYTLHQIILTIDWHTRPFVLR